MEECRKLRTQLIEKEDQINQLRMQLSELKIRYDALRLQISSPLYEADENSEQLAVSQALNMGKVFYEK